MSNTVINWNCRGFRKNVDEIKNLLHDHDPMFFCFQETFLRASKVINFRKYASYHCYSLSSDDRAIGGSSILVKKNIVHNEIKLQTSLQAVAVSLSLHKTFTICSIYLPPSVRVYEQELDNLIEQLPAPFILLGDCNAHNPLWGCANVNDKGRIIENVIGNHDLCVWNDGSKTHIDPATGSLSAIDLSLCSPSLMVDFTWSVHEDLCGSNHYPTFLHMHDFHIPDRVPKWNLNKADWSEFTRICNTELQPNIFEDVKDDPMAVFTSSLHFIAEMTIPKTSNQSKPKHKPWWNDDCQEAKSNRLKALRRFIKTPSRENLDNVRKQYAKSRQVMRESMRNSWKNYVSQLNNRTPIKKAWDMVRKIMGKNTFSGAKHLKVDDRDITDTNEIANTLAGTISNNSSSNHYSEKFQRIKSRTEKCRLNFKSNNSESYNALFSERELKESLDRAHDTAVGPDDIHYQIIKHMPSMALHALLNLFNKIWTSGSFPECWRQATVIPIPKPGKDSTNPTNYRPIALTSCLCKTMERMVNNRLVYYLEYNTILTPYQSGFRKHRSTIDQILRLETVVREAFVRREHTVAIFFDLEKAYDTTWKYGIMRDLHQAGLRGRLPVFIANFLSGRTFSVRLGTILSDPHDQEEGVPQGSILSVTLFSLKINSIVDCLPNGVDCSLYVDDFLVAYSSKHMHTIERQLQQTLNKIQKWADLNGFRFSKTKTVCMHFCQLRKLHPDPTLYLDQYQIPLVDQFKFLGVIFDKKLSFIPHLDKLKSKCLQALNLLKVVSHMDWGADRDVLLRLYRALIRSKLDYGCIVYGSARKSYVKRLDTIHNQGLRICLGAFRTSPMESLYAEANEPSLYRRRDKLSLQYAMKLKSLPNNPAYNSVFHPKYQELFENKPTAIPTFGIRMQRLFSEMDIELGCIAETKLSEVPPWELVVPSTNYNLRIGKKDTTSPFDFQSAFQNLRSQYQDSEFIYTDGSKDDEKVGLGVVTPRTTYKERLPNNCSIYTAELRAMFCALKYIKRSHRNKFVICSDSLSSIQAIEHLNLENPLVLDIVTQHHVLYSRGKRIVFCWVPGHVDISGNEKADKAAKAALNLEVSALDIPYTDFKSQVGLFIWRDWQSFWDNQVDNKLHSIKPVLGGVWTLGQMSRRDQRVYTRVRLGHSYTTHGFLLRGEDPPMCLSCLEHLTMGHILVYCPYYEFIRNRFYSVHSFRELFDTVSPFQICGFLRAVDLYFTI